MAEFLPPLACTRKKTKVALLYDGLPSVPNRQKMLNFFARKGFWAIHPRYRGSWESEGEFLKVSPEQDVSDTIDELSEGLTDIAFGKHFELNPQEIYVIGGSFGGTASLMASLDPRVNKIVANCPVVDWRKVNDAAETANPRYGDYVRRAFGPCYRAIGKNWKKLGAGAFFNPMKRIDDFDPGKVLIFHAKDDDIVPWEPVAAFAKKTGAKIVLRKRGGHGRTREVVRDNWAMIGKFFESRS